jgi:hypothetical protein
VTAGEDGGRSGAGRRRAVKTWRGRTIRLLQSWPPLLPTPTVISSLLDDLLPTSIETVAGGSVNIGACRWGLQGGASRGRVGGGQGPSRWRRIIRPTIFGFPRLHYLPRTKAIYSSGLAWSCVSTLQFWFIHSVQLTTLKTQPYSVKPVANDLLNLGN